MQFLPYKLSASHPNMIVDGAPNEGTILTLSHWPRSGTPKPLLRDTSAEIAFAYLDAPEFHVDVDVVSNNHFDQDGLIGAFTLLEPGIAEGYRQLLIDAAEAGDFGTFKTREGARVAFAISAYSDPQYSPLPKRVFNQSYPEMAAELYSEMLPIFQDLFQDIDRYRELWEREDRKLTESEEMLDSGSIVIEEDSDLDLAVVRLPGDLKSMNASRFTDSQPVTCHPMALHNRTRCNRLALLQPQKFEMQYRYESWVQMISRRPPSRVDLSPLAETLNAQETSNGRWVFDGVDQIIPRLRFAGTVSSTVPEEVLSMLRTSLRTGPPAWNPYA